MAQTRNRTESFQARVSDMESVLASPYGPAGRVSAGNVRSDIRLHLTTDPEP